MAENKRICWVRADGSVAITELVPWAGFPPPEDEEDAQGLADAEAYAIEKTAFELFRWELPNPALQGDALQRWQAVQHFDEWVGEYGGVGHEITTDDLPISRVERNNWIYENGKVVVGPGV